MSVTVMDPLTDWRWCAYVSSHPRATIFHHPSWIKVLLACYGYRSMCLASHDGDTVEGILPLLEVRSWLTGRRGVSLPFSDMCVPLYSSPKVLDDLLGQGEVMMRENGWDYLEFRGDVSRSGLTEHNRYKRHILRLSSDSESVFKTFKKTQIRQRIAKSLRDEIRVERRHDQSALREFMSLNAMTRKKLGVPPQPDKFFELLLENVIAAGHGFISVAHHDGKPVAAAVFLHFANSVCFKYSASDEAYLRYRPNHMILWDAIRWGCEHGFQEFDFGRTDVADAGLLEYKRGWGTEESDLVYWCLSGTVAHSHMGAGSKTKAMRPLLRRLPVSVLKKIGEYFYEHVG